jgi:uncharacterized protein YeaO (DUF488 family)
MTATHTLQTKRVYDPPADGDGTRILIDRIWPRGLTKERAAVDLWSKGIAPSTELHTWFGHDPGRWQEFRERYFAELQANPATAQSVEIRRDRPA